MGEGDGEGGREGRQRDDDGDSGYVNLVVFEEELCLYYSITQSFSLHKHYSIAPIPSPELFLSIM